MNHLIKPPCAVHTVPCPCVTSMEEELSAAGWEPMAVHPNSPVWRAPDGQVYPGPEFAWRLMKNGKEANDVSNID